VNARAAAYRRLGGRARQEPPKDASELHNRRERRAFVKKWAPRAEKQAARRAIDNDRYLASLPKKRREQIFGGVK
jgi:hypothetical protein